MASALMNSQLVGSNHLLVQRAVVNGEGGRSRRLMRSRRSWIAGSLDDDAYTGADSTSAEDVLQGAGESREDILTLQRVVAPQNREAPVLALDARVASLGIDDHTILVPAASQSATLASTSAGRSSGDRISASRSGASSAQPRSRMTPTRSRATKATSGARTVSGSEPILKPVF